MNKSRFLTIAGLLSAIILLTSFNFDKRKVQLIIHPGDCKVEEMHLYQFMGLEFEEITKMKSNKEGNFVFQLPKADRTFFYVGTDKSNVRPVIIGQENEVILKANCKKMRSSVIEKSAENVAYDKLMPRIKSINQKNAQLSRAFQTAMTQKKDLQPLTSDFKALDVKRLNLIKDMAKINPYFEAIATLYSYMSFQNNKGDYKGELDYYVKEYYSQLVKDRSIYNRMPHVFESFKSFVTPLLNIRASEEVKINSISTGLKTWTEGSTAHRLALGAVVQTSMGKYNSIYLYFGNKFVELYGKEYPTATARLQKGLKSMKGLTMGGEAMDIVMNDQDGNELKLSDLRGKYVLIDFWASWCGPCRKENPHVRKLYAKYKDAGFEVFGVSLDRDGKRWKQAIEKDGLNWLHVSDLKGWQNEAAKMYGVRSIPDAFLLDKEGKIIGKKMRGPALDQKLKEVFGF